MINFDISPLKQEEVINKDHLEDYKNGMNFFFSELVRLNINIYIINKIREFPSSLFCVPHDRIFLSMALNNFFEYSVVIITRIISDEGEGKFTLRRFKNRIIKDYIKSEYRIALQDRMKSIKIDDNTIKYTLEKLKTLRDKRIAHTIEEFIQNTEIELIEFKELETLINYLNRVFKLLSFNVDYLMLPIPYSDKVIHPKDVDSRSDIERILDSIAKESGYLMMPEELGKWEGLWEKRKEMISEEEISILNKYRKKFGLPDI